MVVESWFRGLLKSSRKHDHGQEKAQIGVLAFEVASLLSKLVHQWHSLSDKQVAKLREEINNSVGIKKLVSENDDYIVDLICAEMLHNLDCVARVVTRLAKRCNDPLLKCFEHAYDDLIKSGVDQYQWQLTWKKMSKKVKKMEKFILINANLYQEMETLTELEQILRRMKSNEEQDSITLVEYMKKLAWKQQEVKRLKELSLWNRSHDYVVVLLARSIFTIFNRIGFVFGINHVLPLESDSDSDSVSDHMYRSQSVSTLLQSSIHPSENRITLGSIISRSGPISRTNNPNNFYSGPLGNSTTVSGPIKRKNITYSGPIKSTSKSGPLARMSKTGIKLWNGKSPTPHRFSTTGPFKGCMLAGNGSPVKHCYINPNATCSTTPQTIKESEMEIQLPNCGPKHKVFEAPPETLGAAALALHYANVIIVLEKLVASPHLIGHDARDDLYNMLPKNVRSALRVRLKPYAKSLASSEYDMGLAEEWNEAISGTLEWLSPLAHNMIRWQSERSFEHQNLLSKTNMLLVQTLHYANQEKTELTITELLVGLNYIWRFGREVNAKAMMECESGGLIDESVVNSVS
ncbi:protein PSK SIMULATOR 2 [Lactuca sativa]|uniref:protein PSK SIMULATOR 2 n=1 Tax=Lactuca sativa TaxID=4236 RepID=UPI000CC267F4|nr:protein PSK SIMULATOR 2 [Lactuca sativa]XP_023773092.1 protein PSK SIMULATOR 2 [Lactuca sativa]XP_052624588.1 protein PSK SIMULATOR 2 [Lactuca sativa]